MQDDIPYFEDEKNRPLPDVPTIERDNIVAIIYDPKADKFLCLDWPKKHSKHCGKLDACFDF